MLNPVRSSQFKKDFKKAKRQDKDLNLLQSVVISLANEDQLEERFAITSLLETGAASECHVKPDWLLIYKVDGEDLKLARLGSHSELFD